MDGNEIRRRFLSFFEKRGHRVVPSSSLIPNDPTLLLTGAGMNQFKPYFLGLQEPPYLRAASAQKVFRTSDIELVGHTARHVTFFEMLGNFSFGDYFKEEACAWAWELSTSNDGFGLDPERLWVTVFESDDEAEAIWRDQVGVPADRIVRRGMDDNFWSMSVAGPCGPCSELYYDRGPKYGREGGPAVDEDRYMEFWNLVFMQNVRDDDYHIVGDLPKKSIDTGMGLERMAVIQQQVDNIFETDRLRPLLDVAQDITGKRYGEDEQIDISLRVIAEHGRATTMLMADGVLPSNEGRGYVLRRMLRRLVTHTRRLGVDRPVMGELVRATVSLLGDPYPELPAQEPFVLQVAAGEEERFAATFERDISLFQEEVAKAKAGGSGVFPGDAAFRLHDTFGFPVEITVELAAEQGLRVDADEYARLMQEQRTKSQASAKKGDVAQGVLGRVAATTGATEFLGYERLEDEGRVVGVVAGGELADTAGEGERVQLVLNRTPFYAEGGGQVGDAGVIRTPGGEVRVTDTRPGPGGIVVHDGVVTAGQVRTGDQAQAAVDAERRMATARSHTATHVLHHTLRHALGEHARQAGSLVAPGRLRFDFTHFEPVSRQTLEEVEEVANRRLSDDQPVRAYETTYDFARSQGAIGLFGEKYGDLVRVVEVGDYSTELCGGTHVRHTGEIALLRVVSEGSIGSGFRRIEALTGPDALTHVNAERRMLEEVTEAVGGGDPASAAERVRAALARVKQLESELGKIRKADRDLQVERLATGAYQVAGVSLVVSRMDGQGADELRELALALRGRLERSGPGAVVLGAVGDGRALLVAAATKDLVALGVPAPALIEPAAQALGGRSGGKPNLSFGGGSKTEALEDALGSVPARLEALLAPS